MRSSTEENSRILGPQDLVEAKILTTLNQTLWGVLPQSWEALEPLPGSERATASTLVRLAQLPDLESMDSQLLQAAAQAEDHRPKNHPDHTFWRQLQQLLGQLPMDRQGEPSEDLFTLALWWEVSDFPIDELYAQFRHFVPEELRLRSSFLATLAQELLRARARHWIAITESPKHPTGVSSERNLQ